MKKNNKPISGISRIPSPTFKYDFTVEASKKSIIELPSFALHNRY